MSMAHGNDGLVYSESTQIGNVQSWSYDESVDVVDGSGMGDTSKSYYTGINDGSGSVTLNWDPGDTGQDDIVIGASLTLNLYPEGEVATDTYYGGTAVIESINRGGVKEGGMVTMTFGFRGKLAEQVVS